MIATMDQLHEISGFLRRHYPVRRILLYGSCARGEATDDSDVDLLVEADTSEPFYDRMATVRDLLWPYASRFVLSPLVLTPAEITQRLEAGDQFVREIVAMGVEV